MCARGRVGEEDAGEEAVERVGAMTADTPEVRKLADRLAKMKNAQREAVPGIGPRRSEIIVGGALVYASLLERMGLKGFRYSPLGLRDGMLAQMLAEVDLRTSVHQKMESERWAGVLEVCGGTAIEQRRWSRCGSMWWSCSMRWRGCMSCRRSTGCGWRRRR